MFKTLNNGYEIPQIAIGTWKLLNEDVLFGILDEALQLGITHIDTAEFYKNEDIIGKWLMNQNREKLFITSKVWNDRHDEVIQACDEILSRLNTDYLDLLLIHWPVNFKGKFELEKVWRQMEELVQLKKVRSIGVSNFGIKNIEKLMSLCKIKPAVNQIEIHPYLPQYEIRDICKKFNIQVEAYSPFGSGDDSNLSVLKDECINKIAKKHSANSYQIILSFLIAEDLVVIPRTSNRNHLQQNSQLIKLDQEDIELIKSVKIRHRFIDPISFGESRFD